MALQRPPHPDVGHRRSLAADRVFLKACSTLRPQDWDADAAQLKRLSADDWESVADLARRHGLRGLIARGLQWISDRSGVTPPPLAQLRAEGEARLMAQLRKRGAAVEMVRAFAQAGLPLIVFKGLALAEEVFGDISARGFGDCDILVEPGQAEAAKALLEGLGYRPTPDRPVAEIRAQGDHGLMMWRADGAAVDLHWALADQMPERFNVLAWRDAAPARGPGRLGGLRLSPEMTLIHLAVHFCHHDFEEIRPLIDFYVAANRMADRIDRRKLDELARTMKVATSVNLTARLCRRHFRPSPAIEALIAPAPLFPTRLGVLMLGRGALLPTDRRPLRRWFNSFQRRLLTEGLAWTLNWLAPWFIPDREMLVQRFGRPYDWSLYPRYYLRQLRRLTTGSRKRFEDLT